MNVATGKRGTQPVLTGGVYLVLFVLGAVEGLIGSFQYSRMAGSVPLAAIAFCLALLVTCLLAGWGMRSVSGALSSHAPGPNDCGSGEGFSTSTKASAIIVNCW